MAMSRRSAFASKAALFLVLAGCKGAACIAAQAGEFVGAKADAFCDRRFVTDGGQPAPFCQEARETLGGSQFADDCRNNHQAMAGAGLCPREHIIAGCKLHKENDDKSEVYDWYYDVSDILAEAGASAGRDGGPTFEETQSTRADVERLCTDPDRYEEGADTVDP